MVVEAALLLALKTEGCRVACLYEGYDSGFFQKENCFCVDRYLYTDLLMKKSSRIYKVQPNIPEEPPAPSTWTLKSSSVEE